MAGSLLQDLRLSIRALRRAPSFALVVIVTLALGIGATSAIFSVVHGVLLRPLPYDEPDRIVAVLTTWTDAPQQAPRLSGGDFLDLQQQASDVFEAVSVVYGGSIGVSVGDAAEFAGTYFVLPDFFRVLRARPEAGRLLLPMDAHLVVVSHGFAVRHFAGAAEAVGRTVLVDGTPYGIVGVLQPGDAYPRNAEVWAAADPRQVMQAGSRSAFNFPTVARLRSGVELSAARARLTTLGEQLAVAYPDTNGTKRFTVVPLHERVVGRVRDTLYLLLGAVGLVLLIACANVSSLLLARGSGRAREMAVRATLGATRARLLRQLLVESLVLGVVGGLLGLLVAWAGLATLLHLAPHDVPRLGEVAVDGTVLAFTLGITLLTSVLVGIMPAWRAARPDLHDTLKQGGTRGPLGGGAPRLRSALVAGEIAAAVVLAIGAGLLFRSFLALNTVDLGYDPDRLLVMYAHAPARSDDDHARAARQLHEAIPALAAIPGVQRASSVMGLPSGQYGSHGAYAIEGKHTFASGQKLPVAGFRLASPGYVGTMGMRVVRGRDFMDADAHGAHGVAIISEALARQSFGSEDPIGRRIQCGLSQATMEPMTIVGVVSDIRHDSPAAAPEPQLYMPLLQHPSRANEVQFVLRTEGDPMLAAAAARDVMTRSQPGVALRFTTMEETLAETVATPRYRTVLVSAFALVALVLAAVGVFGVMNYVAAQRTGEFGLRSALGASPAALLRLMLVRAAALAIVGIGIGVALATVATRAVESMLFGLEPVDPMTWASVIAAVATVTLLASAWPAWRASRVDPMVALRDG
jgi:putative ABC transport system permease protein